MNISSTNAYKFYKFHVKMFIKFQKIKTRDFFIQGLFSAGLFPPFFSYWGLFSTVFFRPPSYRCWTRDRSNSNWEHFHDCHLTTSQ